MALPPSTIKLPQEDDHADFAWADNVGRSVVARKGDERLFLTMQWRHDNVHGGKFPPSEGKPVTSNGICRVQVTNATVDRLATVGCSSETGEPLTALHVLKFGHWLVAMNSNLYLAEDWAVPASYVGRKAREMVSGKGVPQLPATYNVAANQTMVLFVDYM